MGLTSVPLKSTNTHADPKKTYEDTGAGGVWVKRLKCHVHAASQCGSHKMSSGQFCRPYIVDPACSAIFWRDLAQTHFLKYKRPVAEVTDTIVA